MPENARHRSYFSQSIKAMKMKGNTFSTIQKGWVMIWKRLMRRTPWVTSGMTMTAEMM